MEDFPVRFNCFA